MKSLVIYCIFFFLTANTFAQQSFEKKDGKIYFEGKIYTGLYTVYTENNIVSEFEIKNGLEDGKVTHFYPNKEVKEIGFYKNGQKDGKWEKWDLNKKKIGEAYYENGIKSGTWIVWDHQGTKRNEMTYANGERAGNWKVWDEKGTLLQEKNF